jgi:N-acetyl-anhydromuramyl-L-alanine amidase AmpD
VDANGPGSCSGDHRLPGGGTYNATITAFGDPAHGASTHYVIRSADGEITQMVHTDDVAFHAGNWTFNGQAIGIEHEGFVADGATWFTEQMYRSSARLVRYLAQRYDIPLDRRHILGSDEIQRGTPERVAGAHYDPATYWNWPHFMALLGGQGEDESRIAAEPGIVTITPPFDGNEQPVLLRPVRRRRGPRQPHAGARVAPLRPD